MQPTSSLKDNPLIHSLAADTLTQVADILSLLECIKDLSVDGNEQAHQGMLQTLRTLRLTIEYEIARCGVEHTRRR